MEDTDILHLYELNYSDLLLVSSTDGSSPSPEEFERLESMSKAIMEALGPMGPGLLSITGVPNAADLRRNLLPLARKLALLDPNHRKLILKVCSTSTTMHLHFSCAQVVKLMCLFRITNWGVMCL